MIENDAKKKNMNRYCKKILISLILFILIAVIYTLIGNSDIIPKSYGREYSLELKEGNIYYKYIFNPELIGVTITRISNAVGDVTIPDKVGGYYVIDIEDRAFQQNYNITSIILPEKLERIGYGLFMNCKGLKEIEIKAYVKEIEDYAFYGCNNLEKVNIRNKDNNLYLTYIGESAFSGCTSLKEFNIPNHNNLVKILSIGDNAFEGCKNLKSFTLYASITTIGDHAFAKTSNLELYTEYGSNLSYIGKEIFYGATHITVNDCKNSYKLYNYLEENYKVNTQVSYDDKTQSETTNPTQTNTTNNSTPANTTTNTTTTNTTKKTTTTTIKKKKTDNDCPVIKNVKVKLESNGKDVIVTWTATDNGLGVKYWKISNKAKDWKDGWKSYDKNYSSKNGQATINVKDNDGPWYIYVKDAAGNARSYKLTAKNTLNLKATIDGDWNKKTIKWTVTDANGIKYWKVSQEDEWYKNYTKYDQVKTSQSQKTKEINKSGTWYIYVKDIFGNAKRVVFKNVQIDSKDPILENISVQVKENGKYAELTFKAKDECSGLKYWSLTNYDPSSSASESATFSGNSDNGSAAGMGQSLDPAKLKDLKYSQVLNGKKEREITYKINQAGKYWLTVEDKAGHIATKTITVSDIDNVKPYVTKIAKESTTGITLNGINYLKKGSIVYFKASFSEKVTIDNSKLKIEGANCQIFCEPSNSYYLMYVIGGSEDGEAKIIMEEGFLTDAAGNKSAKKVWDKAKIFVDNSAPVANVVPEKGNYRKLVANIKDNSGIAEYQWSVFDENSPELTIGNPKEYKFKNKDIKTELNASVKFEPKQGRKVLLVVKDIEGNERVYTFTPQEDLTGPKFNLFSIAEEEKERIVTCKIQDEETGISKYQILKADENNKIICEKEAKNSIDANNKYNEITIRYKIKENGKYKIIAWNKQGIYTEREFEINNIDNTKLQYKVSYKRDKDDINKVHVTITANKEIKEKGTSNWTLSDDKKTLERIYEEEKLRGTDVKESVIVTDNVGNEETIKLEDKIAPKRVGEIQKEKLDNGNTKVTITFSEELKETTELINKGGWTLSVDKKTISKEIDKDVSVVNVGVEDLAGNKTKVVDIIIDRESSQVEPLYESQTDDIEENTPTEEVTRTITFKRPIQKVEEISAKYKNYRLSDDKKTLQITFSGNVYSYNYIKVKENESYSETIELNPRYNIVSKGDSNVSGHINTTDLVMMWKHVLGTKVYDKEDIKFAMDITKNNIIDIQDLTYLRDKIEDEYLLEFNKTQPSLKLTATVDKEKNVTVNVNSTNIKGIEGNITFDSNALKYEEARANENWTSGINSDTNKILLLSTNSLNSNEETVAAIKLSGLDADNTVDTKVYLENVKAVKENGDLVELGNLEVPVTIINENVEEEKNKVEENNPEDAEGNEITDTGDATDEPANYEAEEEEKEDEHIGEQTGEEGSNEVGEENITEEDDENNDEAEEEEDFYEDEEEANEEETSVAGQLENLANKVLPKTGVGKVLLPVSLIIAVIAFVFYRKYKNSKEM